MEGDETMMSLGEALSIAIDTLADAVARHTEEVWGPCDVAS